MTQKHNYIVFCTACKARFYVGEAALKTASGFVRCGACSKVFNAAKQISPIIDANEFEGYFEDLAYSVDDVSNDRPGIIDSADWLDDELIALAELDAERTDDDFELPDIDDDFFRDIDNELNALLAEQINSNEDDYPEATITDDSVQAVEAKLPLDKVSITSNDTGAANTGGIETPSTTVSANDSDKSSDPKITPESNEGTTADEVIPVPNDPLVVAKIPEGDVELSSLVDQPLAADGNGNMPSDDSVRRAESELFSPHEHELVTTTTEPASTTEEPSQANVSKSTDLAHENSSDNDDHSLAGRSEPRIDTSFFSNLSAVDDDEDDRVDILYFPDLVFDDPLTAHEQTAKSTAFADTGQEPVTELPPTDVQFGIDETHDESSAVQDDSPLDPTTGGLLKHVLSDTALTSSALPDMAVYSTAKAVYLPLESSAALIDNPPSPLDIIDDSTEDSNDVTSSLVETTEEHEEHEEQRDSNTDLDEAEDRHEPRADQQADPEQYDDHEDEYQPHLAEADLQLEQQRKPHQWGWSVAFVLLLVLTAAQVSLVKRNSWAQDAQYRQLYETACAVIGCELPLYRNANELIISNLSLEPDTTAGLLVVELTVSNQARFAQPLPSLSLEFSSADGIPIAQLDFTLKDIAIGELGDDLQPDSEVQLKFYVADPGNVATSYQVSVF